MASNGLTEQAIATESLRSVAVGGSLSKIW